ncbi:MAG: YdiU family protein [Steroidobacteraceae bacterium]
MNLGLEHSYSQLPSRFFARVAPEPARAPALLVFNEPLARELDLPYARTDAQRHAWAQALSGNRPPDDARPLAMAYAGHQFAHFVAELGDGRALLLGEKRHGGRRYDIQLKGSGRTPFSRGGDGRAALGPMLREYLVSEAMHALGIPTTRSLAVVATGEPVFRDSVLPGAVLTRVATSHLRVGTFQYFRARNDVEGLRLLLDYAIARHDPDLAAADSRALAFLERVAQRQASLIAQWMSVGFIHGVMNTDNMTLSGETIDYGPCAFMDHYDPHTVFSSIDRRGRYAFGNQPAIAQWNLARLADALLPLIEPDEQRAIGLATVPVQRFAADFDLGFRQRMGAKLGLMSVRDADAPLISDLLMALHVGHADFTSSLRALADAALGAAHEEGFRQQFREPAAVDEWLAAWRRRLATEGATPTQVREGIRSANPAFIARNHRVEQALAAASDHGDLAPFTRLLTVLQQPFADQPGMEDLARPPRDDERVAATFCGT